MEYVRPSNEKMPVAFTKDVTTGAASVSFFGAGGAPFDFEIVDVVIQPRGASTNGTMTLKNGATAITDAITCAVDKTIDRAATIDDAQSTISKGGDITIVCAGDAVASTIGLVTVYGVRV